MVKFLFICFLLNGFRCAVAQYYFNGNEKMTCNDDGACMCESVFLNYTDGIVACGCFHNQEAYNEKEDWDCVPHCTKSGLYHAKQLCRGAYFCADVDGQQQGLGYSNKDELDCATYRPEDEAEEDWTLSSPVDPDLTTTTTTEENIGEERTTTYAPDDDDFTTTEGEENADEEYETTTFSSVTADDGGDSGDGGD